MKILVYPHDLKLGGSQLNAIEIAARTRDLGHDVAVYGQSGPLCRVIEDLGLTFIPSPRVRRRPTPAIVADLRRTVRAQGIEVVHGYEWPPILEARLATAATAAGCVGTVMSMSVAPFLPTDIPLIVGTEQIAAAERDFGRRSITVIEPPVDVASNGPEVWVDTDGFRSEFGIPDSGLHVVVVSRLAKELKLEGLLVAIDVVPQCTPDATLTVVGAGPAESEVRRAVDRSNRRFERPRVFLTGEVLDPRPAYASADIVLGMGGSALRAMAFGKPLVVQGENGFWRTLTPDSLAEFLWGGWYGIGARPEDGPERLRAELEPLAASPSLRAARGTFGRQVVLDRFALEAAARRQVEVYGSALAHRGPTVQGIRCATEAISRFVGSKVRGYVSHRRGLAPQDDFNARPVTGKPAGR